MQIIVPLDHTLHLHYFGWDTCLFTKTTKSSFAKDQLHLITWKRKTNFVWFSKLQWVKMFCFKLDLNSVLMSKGCVCNPRFNPDLSVESTAFALHHLEMKPFCPSWWDVKIPQLRLLISWAELAVDSIILMHHNTLNEYRSCGNLNSSIVFRHNCTTKNWTSMFQVNPGI